MAAGVDARRAAAGGDVYVTLCVGAGYARGVAALARSLARAHAAAGARAAEAPHLVVLLPTPREDAAAALAAEMPGLAECNRAVVQARPRTPARARECASARADEGALRDAKEHKCGGAEGVLGVRVVLHDCAPLPNPFASAEARYAGVFTKLRAWSLHAAPFKARRALFLDADTLVLDDVRDLFERVDPRLPRHVVAAPDVLAPDRFNAGVLAFAVAPAAEAELLAALASGSLGSYDAGDQGWLNEYFSGWYESDARFRLPLAYNLPAEVAAREPMLFRSLCEGAAAHGTATPPCPRVPRALLGAGCAARVLHFWGGGNAKPWAASYAAFFDAAEGGTAARRRKLRARLGAERYAMLAAWWRIYLDDDPRLERLLSEDDDVASFECPRGHDGGKQAIASHGSARVPGEEVVGEVLGEALENEGGAERHEELAGEKFETVWDTQGIFEGADVRGAEDAPAEGAHARARVCPAPGKAYDAGAAFWRRVGSTEFATRMLADVNSLPEEVDSDTDSDDEEHTPALLAAARRARATALRAGVVPVLVDPGAEEVRSHLRSGCPCVVRGWLPRWRCYTSGAFTLAALAARRPSLEVRIDMNGRSEGGGAPEWRVMTLAEFEDAVARAGSDAKASSRELPYLRLWTYAQDFPELAKMAVADAADGPFKDHTAAVLAGTKGVQRRPSSLPWWVFAGPPGTRAPLHVDPYASHAWFAQLCGAKRFELYPPEDCKLLHDGADFVDADALRRAQRVSEGGGSAHGSHVRCDTGVTLLERFPKALCARRVTAAVGEGDLLVLPANWAHAVYADSAGEGNACVSLTHNFVDKAGAAELRALYARFRLNKAVK